MVRSLSIEELRDLYEVREALELVVVRRAVERVDDDLLTTLRSHLDKARELLDAGGSWGEYQQLDRMFHATLWGTTANNRAITLLSQLADVALVHDTRIPPDRMVERMRSSVREHDQIVEAIAERDLAAAEEAFRHHVMAYKRALIDRINGVPGEFV